MTAALAAAGRWWPVQQYPLGRHEDVAPVLRVACRQCGVGAGRGCKQEGSRRWCPVELRHAVRYADARDAGLYGAGGWPRWLDGPWRDADLMSERPLGLSRREASVVVGLVGGLQMKQIALRMQTSKATLDCVVRGAKDKTGCPTLSALAVAWVRATEVRQAYERGKADADRRMAA